MAFAINSSTFLRRPLDSHLCSSVLSPPQHLASPNVDSNDLVNPKDLCLDRRKGGAASVKCRETTENRVISGDRMLHWVSVLRNEQTPCPIFRNAMAELGRLLIYEASRDWLPTIPGEISSPMVAASVGFIDPREPVAIVPILRAGLALAEHASSVLPATSTYHLGISRDEETLQPSV